MSTMAPPDSTSAPASTALVTPNSAYRGMARAAGTWRFSGGLRGTVRFEWKEGGLYLVQHLDAEHDGRRIKGMEVVGPRRPLDAGREGGSGGGLELVSRYFDYHTGLTLDYVYEPDDDGFTVWLDAKGSGAYCRARFDEGGRTLRGRWVYPGGGYELIADKID